MATYDWPEALVPQRAAWGSQGAGEQFKSPYNGTLQVVDYVAERWVVSATLPPARRVNAGAVEAFAMILRGGVHRVRVWHFGRPVPIGTMRGSPTLSGAVSRGGTSLPITGGTASSTLKAGDMLGAGGQLFMVASDVTLNGSGAGSVPVVHRVRATIAGGSAVTWNRPTGDFIVPAWLASVVHGPGLIEGAALDLEEVW
jgi:hypothetical protein